MSNYKFHAGNGPVIIREGELLLPRMFAPLHLSKAEVAAVRIESVDTPADREGGDFRQHADVIITAADGTERRYQEVLESAREIAAQFSEYGYKVDVAGLR